MWGRVGEGRDGRRGCDVGPRRVGPGTVGLRTAFFHPFWWCFEMPVPLMRLEFSGCHVKTNICLSSFRGFLAVIFKSTIMQC